MLSDLGCPCGCLTRPPWLDDPNCIRHRWVIGPPLDWAEVSCVGAWRGGELVVIPLRDYRESRRT